MENKIYLVVNDNKVELPDELITQIQNHLKTEEQKEYPNDPVILEFLSYMNEYKKYYKKKSNSQIFHEDGYLKVEYPSANPRWTFELWDACQKFCRNKGGFPSFSLKNKPNFMYIRLGH